MIFYIFAPLLFLLSAAAPLADDQAHSPVLQKRHTVCSPLYGRGIVESDCSAALQDMRRMTVSSTHPATGLTIPSMGAFSRFNPDGHYRLPQRFSVRTCTILVDTLQPGLTLVSNWDLLAGLTGNVISECVHDKGDGGENGEGGFNIAILNAANLDLLVLPAFERCVNLINMQQHLDSFTQCLLDTIESDQARSRITQRRARRAEAMSVRQEIG